MRLFVKVFFWFGRDGCPTGNLVVVRTSCFRAPSGQSHWRASLPDTTAIAETDSRPGAATRRRPIGLQDILTSCSRRAWIRLSFERQQGLRGKNFQDSTEKRSARCEG